MKDHGFPLFNFGDMIKIARKRKRFTQKKLAQLLGVHYNTISAWELGTYLPETRGVVLELARCLGLDEQESRHLLEASLTALSPRWNVPYLRNPFFTGCEQILRKIHEVFHGQQQSMQDRICALSGLAGVGKTQCAIEYAYRYVNRYSAVLWFNAQTYESLVASVIATANLLALPERREQEQHRVVTAVTQWLNRQNEWLLIFDDVEDLALVKEFLPTTQHGYLLLTSRRQSLNLTSHVLDLGYMPVEDGVHFLLRRVGLLTPTASSHLGASDRSAAKKIVLVMGGLPLALDQAGSYIESSQCSLSDYLHFYKMAQLRMLDEREPHADHADSVARTFTLIFEKLKSTDPLASELLIACAFLASEAIPDTFFLKGATELGPTLKKLTADLLSFYAAIKTLRIFSLLQRDVGAHTLTMHCLVQVMLKEGLSRADQQIWTKRVMRAMYHIFPSNEMVQVDYWQNCQQLLPHAMHIIAQNELENKDVALDCTDLMNCVANYLIESAGYAEAEKLLHKAWCIEERVLGVEHLNTAHTLHCQAVLFLRQGKYDRVEPLCLQALHIRERALGHAHYLVASSLYCLALLYVRQGRYEEAEQHYLEALVIQEQNIGPNHPQVATSLSGLAVLYGEQSRYREAEQLYQRALSIRELALGPDHPQVATLLNNIAHDYMEQKRYEEAEPLFQRALHIWEQHLGPDHPRVAYPLSNLAELYQMKGNHEEAELLFRSALRIWEQKLGPEHYLVADALEGLAHLYQDQGKLEEAESLYLQSLGIREKALGLQHPYVSISLTGLAMLYKMEGKYEEAASLYQRALQIKEHMLGSAHPEIAEILRYQACICQAQQQFPQALALLRQAVTILEQAAGPDHQKTKAARCAYTQLLQELGHEKEVKVSTIGDY